MSRPRYRVNVTMRERVDMAKFFIALSQLPRLGKPEIDLPKLRDAYQSIKWDLKII